MTIYLIRHGETDWNIERRLQGREDTELNANGIRQAEACGKAFLNIPVDGVVSSPLKRAKQTAEIIASFLDVPKVLIDDDFIERDFGKLSGFTPEERKNSGLSEEDAGVESFGHLTSRLIGALRRYSEQGVYQHLIVVSHGAAINAVLAVLSDRRIGTGKTWLKNTCINILHAQGKAIEIVRYNLTAEEIAKNKIQ